MVTVDEYGRIRRAHRDGMSIRAMAITFHHSRRKIREILATPEPKPYLRLRPSPSVLDPFKSIIDDILKADAEAPRKQRHTAMKLFRRLRQEHGYQGSYERVRLYVRDHGIRHRETFIPLDHDPGQRVEADFGFIYVDFPEGRRQIPVLVMTWSYSNCPFAVALPTQRTEAILHGMAEAFAFFGCVPREVWWDNATALAPHLFVGRQRQLNPRYQALASHYNFEPMFCLVRRPQEKPRVEGRVQFLQQDWCTPVPKVKDQGELNAYLRACCEQDRLRMQAGQTETIGQRFDRDRAHGLALPVRVFDACIHQAAKVDKYQMVRFDHNGYSVPRAYAFATVTVKGYIDQIAVVAGAQVIARHRRVYERGEQVLDPVHYLASLGRRPAALDHANVYRHWQLPALFLTLRQDLEKQHGAKAGARHYIRVLQCLAEHPVARVERAIASSRVGAGYAAEAIVQKLRSFEVPETATAQDSVLDWSACPPGITKVQVPLVNLRQFDQLLSREEVTNVPSASVPQQSHTGPPSVGEGQSETTAAANHACRIREAGPGGGQCQRDLRAISVAADRDGGDGAGSQRLAGPHQAGDLPGVQGLRHL
jgi:transposase